MTTTPPPTPFRDPQASARLSHTFAQSFTASDLAELLLSLDETQPASLAREVMRERGVSVLGVRRAGAIVGWISADDPTTGTLVRHTRPFHPHELRAADAGLDLVLGAFTEAQQIFIQWLGAVAGVITRRDLQKPPLRMWLFGAITILDTNLTDAVEEIFPGDSWLDRISEGRAEKARTLRTYREQSGSVCRLVDCLQIKDKTDILVQNEASLAALGVASRREAKQLTSDMEKLRNHLAHAQELEPAHLATAARLSASIHSIISGEGARRIIAAHRAAAPHKT
jgi:hypothetical protein